MEVVESCEVFIRPIRFITAKLKLSGVAFCYAIFISLLLFTKSVSVHFNIFMKSCAHEICLLIF